MSDTPTPPTLAEAKATLLSTLRSYARVEYGPDGSHPYTDGKLAREDEANAEEVAAVITAAQREAAGRVWCASCHKIVLNGPHDIHTCYDADSVQRARIAELEAWKQSAMEVLAAWDAVWEAAGRPGPLGSGKAENTLREVERLRAAREAAP